MAGRTVGGRPSTDPEDLRRIQTALKRLREERYEGKEVKLAKALGLSQSAVSQLLNGKTTPSLGSLRRIATLSGVSVGQLLDGTDFEPFPHRALACQMAEDGGVPRDVVEAVLGEEITEDRSVWEWFQRIQALTVLRRAKVA